MQHSMKSRIACSRQYAPKKKYLLNANDAV